VGPKSGLTSVKECNSRSSVVHLDLNITPELYGVTLSSLSRSLCSELLSRIALSVCVTIQLYNELHSFLVPK
jgi:hypothetical protein